MNAAESLILAHAVGLALLLGYGAWLIYARDHSDRKR